jgi:hypothetical protein
MSREPRIAWIGGFIAGTRVDPALANRARRNLSNEGELFSRFAHGYLAVLLLKKRQYACAPFADFVRFSYGQLSNESIALHESCQASLSLCRRNQFDLQQFLGSAYQSGRELAESKPAKAMELAVEHREEYLSTVRLFERLFDCPMTDISDASHSDVMRRWISTHPELAASESWGGGLELLRHCYDFMWWLGLACVVGVELDSQDHASHPETDHPEPAAEYEPAGANAREPESKGSVRSIAGALVGLLIALVGLNYFWEHFAKRTLETAEEKKAKDDLAERWRATGKNNQPKPNATSKNVELVQHDRGADTVAADHAYIRIFNTIKAGDNLVDKGQGRNALEKYLEAERDLKKLKTDYPSWNAKIVTFRLNYLAGRIGPLKVQYPQTPPMPLEPLPNSGKTFPLSANAGTTQEKTGTAGPVLGVGHDWFYLASRKRPTTLPKVPVANDAAARWKNLSAEFRRLQAGRDWFRDTGGSLVRDYFASVTACHAPARAGIILRVGY